MHIEKEYNDLEANFYYEDYLTGQKTKVCNHMRVSISLSLVNKISVKITCMFTNFFWHLNDYMSQMWNNVFEGLTGMDAVKIEPVNCVVVPLGTTQIQSCYKNWRYRKMK